MQVNFNGQLMAVEVPYLPHGNRGLYVGDAVFESLRVMGGKAVFWEDHYLRLMSSMRMLRMEIPMAFTMEFLANEIKTLLEERKTLKKRYEDIHTAQEALIKGNANETRRLLKELQKTQEDLQAREDRLRELENQLNQKKLSLDALRLELEEQKDLLEKKNQQIEARNARLIELESVLHRKDSIVANLKSRVQDALLGFQNMGLSVSTKNGKVYVSLAEKLLFTSGSTVVDKKGVQALKELAGVLEQNPDINIMIEGHTDDVPMNPNSALKDNWGLSVARATSIVRILIDNSKIDPKRITACGRGEYVTIDPAKTKEARKKNRRTEIILTPKLDEILEILGSN